MSDDPFALDSFAPPEFTRFRLRKHGDHEFRIDGDPDTGDVALMLRIEEKMRGAENEEQAVEASAEGKELLVRLIREQDPDIEDVKIGMQEVLVLFSLIIRGASVAAAVGEAITARPAGDGEERKLGDESAHEEGEPGPEEAEVAPLPSAERLSTRSLGSESETVGLLATGTG